MGNDAQVISGEEVFGEGTRLAPELATRATMAGELSKSDTVSGTVISSAHPVHEHGDRTVEGPTARGLGESASVAGTEYPASARGVAEGRSAVRTTPDRQPMGAMPLGAMPRAMPGSELSARQIKQLNSTKAGMVFKLEAGTDFFTWVRW